MTMPFRRTFAVACLTLGLAWLAAASRAHAEAPVSTLARIAETGTIRIGYGDSPPFSFRAADGEVTGYSIELCSLLADRIRQVLKMDRISLQYVPRTPSNRIRLLDDGAFDIECSSSSNVAQRSRAATFAPPHFFVRTRFVSLAANGLKTLESLRGHAISVTRGTVNATQISTANRELHLNLSVVPVESVASAFDLVANGRVAAFAMDDAMLYNLIAASGRPADFSLSTEPLGDLTPLGFMTRSNDKEFGDLVAKLLRQIYASPAMPNIYDRWFMQPITDKHLVMDMPMSQELKLMLSASGVPAPWH